MEMEMELELEGWKSMTILVNIICGIIYSFYVLSKLPKGFPRLFAVFPVIAMYTALPWQFSSPHMREIIAFAFVWLGSFKLLMLCFEVGPLVNPRARSNLFHFMVVAVFPIQVRQLNSEGNSDTTSSKLTTLIKVTAEGCLLVIVLFIYSFRTQIPQNVILVLYAVHLYLFLDIFLGSLSALANVCLGVEIEPHFNKPYLSSSLEDFWGKRWNLTVTKTLRPSVYYPILNIFWNTHKRLQKKNAGNQQMEVNPEKPPFWARAVAVSLTFLVSGLMHELLYFYVTETRATWEVTVFFIFNGLCTAIEICLRRGLSPCITLPKSITIPLTLIFLYSAGFWLFFPPITRCGIDIKAIAEYEFLTSFLFPVRVQN